MTAANDLAVRRALEAAGVIFIDESGGAGPGCGCANGKEKQLAPGRADEGLATVKRLEASRSRLAARGRHDEQLPATPGRPTSYAQTPTTPGCLRRR